MSKVTDYNAIYASVESQLQQYEWTLLEYCDSNIAKIIVANIYITQDFAKGYGQDVSPALSVISSPHRISIILDGHRSHYKWRKSMVEYENLDDDIYSILFTIQAVFDRIQFLM